MFIENAFKHSTASQSEDIFIDISIKIDVDGQLDFKCKNTYQADTNTEKLSNGIGLQNVKKRLQLLYPDAHKLVIRDTKNNYFVHLKMNLKSIAL